MSYIVVIREQNYKDAQYINDLVRGAYLSNVNSAWYNALLKEITFQLVVMSAAVMFIFLGVPLFYCFVAVPFVMLLIYLIVYASFLAKAIEVITSKKPVQCWVAEAYLPYFFARDPRNCSFQIVRKIPEGLDLSDFQKKIVGTVSVMNNLHSPHSAWLFRLVVEKNYRNKGIGRELVRVVKDYCKGSGYLEVHAAVSECQENARQIFTDNGFQLRLMYHKQLVGTALTLLMYHLECALEPDL